MQIIPKMTFEEVRKQLSSSKPPVIFTSDDDELNRRIIEKLEINIFLINQAGRKDFQKQRNSGFNQIMAKIAKKKGIAIGINLDEIINSRGRQKADILARTRQNIKICNKNKLKMVFVSASGIKRDIYDLKSLGAVLGMPTWMTKYVKIF